MRGFGVTWPGTEHAHRLLNPRIFTNWGNQMRTIKQYLEAAKARKENGEAGFSLVELIVVVVILGILAAVAIPIFNGIQDQARQSSLESIVGNGAAQTASDIAQGNEANIDPNLTALATQSDDQLPGIALVNTGGTNIDDYCISGTSTDITTPVTSGPGC